MHDLATRFEQDMRADSREYTRVTGTNPSRYLQMIAEIGAVDTARVLGANPAFHEGFTRAWESGCLDLTVEYLMIYAREGAYRPLFSDEELKTARRKLKQVGIESAISRKVGAGTTRHENRYGCFLPDLTGLATASSARLPRRR